MTAQGLPCSIAGVAKAYEDFLDLLICDTRDARAAEFASRKRFASAVHRKPSCASAEDKAALARTVLSFTMNGSSSDPLSVRQICRSRRRRPAVILIPVKNLSAAKQRLAAVLDQTGAHGIGAHHVA